MGLDFTQRCAPSWNRGWDSGKDELEHRTLFTSLQTGIEQTFRAKPILGATLEPNREVILTVCDDVIRLGYGTQTIGMSIKPSQTLLHAIVNNGDGIAVGIIERISPLTGSAEVRVIH